MKNNSEINFDEETLKKIHEVLDAGDKKIHYNDFITACLSSSIYLNEHQLKVAFDYYDTDKNNKISREELKKGLQNENKTISNDEVDQLMLDVV